MAAGWWEAAGAVAALEELAGETEAPTGPAPLRLSACSRRITTTTTLGTRCCRRSTTCPMQQVRAEPHPGTQPGPQARLGETGEEP